MDQEPILRLDSLAVSETTLPGGFVRETNLTIELTVWRTAAGFPVCLDACHAHGRQVQEMHLSSLAAVYAWVMFQALPVTNGLRLTGEGPFRVGDQLRVLADRFLEWVRAHPQQPPSVCRRLLPVFYFDVGTETAKTLAAVEFAGNRREVRLSIAFQATPKGVRTRLCAESENLRTTLETVFGNTHAIRTWLLSAGPQLAGALGVSGMGDRVFQSVLSGLFIPELAKCDECRTQPVTAHVNAVRATRGLPPLGDGPIPVVPAPAQTVVWNSGAYRTVSSDIHTFPDTVVNR